MKKKAFRAAVPYTVPVLTGYLFLGIAYGIFMTGQGFPVWLPCVMSLLVYAGSMQFVAAALLLSAFSPLSALAMTLVVNARHIFYGISMLGKYRDTGRKKWYLIFGMSDETFSVNVGVDPPKGVDRGWFMFFITLLHQSYWVLATCIGAGAGSLIPFDTTGIDFVMTALFLVIFLNQWMETKEHIPAMAGVAAAVLCRLAFGADNFMIPAMGLIFVLLTISRGKIEEREAKRS